ncbi:MAG TPA: hypothetical protein VGQ83_08975 [Polyangia bacterium]
MGMPAAVTVPLEVPQSAQAKDRALKILAKSIYKELRQNGYEAREVVALSTEIIDLITADMRPDPAKNRSSSQ